MRTKPDPRPRHVREDIGRLRLSPFSSGNHAGRLAIQIAGYPDAFKVRELKTGLAKGHREAAADLREMVCEKARRIILKMTLQVSRP
jgi:hypothetical protein